MKNYNISLIKGDGVGPEVIDEAVKVLNAVADKQSFTLNYTDYLMGGCAIDATGNPLPQETIDGIKASDACLFGAIGGAKWEKLASDKTPEAGLLKMRKELNLFTNLRPVKVYDSLVDASSLKPEVVKNVDIMFVRELTGGIYFGEKYTFKEDEHEYAYDKMQYSRSEITRIAHVAFKQAMSRSKKLHSVDKANVLAVSRLWRKTVEEVSKEYPEVELQHMYVDNTAMQLVRNPKQFDVILTSNLMGDILSDEASEISGSIGLLASASVNGEGPGVYEPIHGSAPDIAKKGIVNPIATIDSAAMMLRDLGETKAADNIVKAINEVLNMGYRTNDISSDDVSMDKRVTCEQMGNLIAHTIKGLDYSWNKA